jgi:tRNA(Ile)-lysidine synthase
VGFTPHALTPLLQSCPTNGRRWVALSGGVDSTVLLHALVQLDPDRVHAIHVHHGLQAAADQWVAHCQQFCEQLRVPLTVLQVDARAKAGESPEAVARQLRYRAFESVLEWGDQLLTAHHQQDQAETFLLRALRGAGPRGLAAMRPSRPLGAGLLLRPLLECPQQELIDYAERAGLKWVEDPSNRQTDADRNFLRHQLLPLLQQRWPAAVTTLSRSAGHCAEADRLLRQQGRGLLAGVERGDPLPLIEGESVAQSKLRIRSWLDLNAVDTPDSVHLQRVVEEVLPARKDAMPLVEWSALDGERIHLRRYRQALYLLRESSWGERVLEQEWDLQCPLPLSQNQQLEASETQGGGISLQQLQGRRCTLRWRKGGERCQPLGSSRRRRLKSILQERAIPPWERERTPLIYLDDELVQVVGHFVCEPFRARGNEKGVVIQIAAVQ